MSATIGILVSLTIFFKAFVESSSGQDTLTMSAPASCNLPICFIVALVSVVSVLVMDCTEIGESPPTLMFPTFIFFVFFLIIFRYGLISIV